MLDMLAIGELNVDLIFTGLKTPPVLGREILASGMEVAMGSSTAICACAAASLGLRVAFVGRVGRDAYGTVAVATLQKYGVETALLRDEAHWRTGATVSLSTERDRAMVTYPGDTIASLDGTDADFARFPAARHIHVGSYFLQTALRPHLPALFAQAHARGMTVSLDAGWDDAEDWQIDLTDVDVFFPNESEAMAIAGTADVREAARRIAKRGCACAVKRGGEGSLFCDREGNILEAPAYPALVLDTTGAGDSFNAGFLRAYLRGLPPRECLRYGNAAGAVSVKRAGGATQCPTIADILEMIQA